MRNLERLARPISAAAALWCLGAWMLAGCGGGGTSSSAATGRATLTITWPDRGRLIPLAANSLRVVFSLGGTVLQTKVVVRPPAGATSTVTFSELKVGTLALVAAAYPNADGTGTAQAQGATPVAIAAGQVTNVTLTMQSTIDRVELTPSTPSIQLGGVVQMTATARDVSGSIVLTWPTKMQWDTANHSVATVSSTGLVTGVATGATAVSVTELESGKSAAMALAVVGSTLIAADSFDYAAGAELVGRNGGTGWTTAWGCHGPGRRSAIASTGLTFGRLRTAGLSAVTTSGRPIGDDRSVGVTFGAPGTTMFIAVLVRPNDPLGSGTDGSYFGTGFGNCFVGYTHGNRPNYGIERGGGGGWVGSNVAARQNETAFLVVRFTFTSGDDTIDLFVNPTPGQPLPAKPDATKSDLDLGTGSQLGWGASTRCQFDEFRAGRTWEDVAPVAP